MFANTNCPGGPLQNRFPELAQTVNSQLDGGTIPTPTPTPEPANRLDPNKEEKPMYKFRNGKTYEDIYADTRHTKWIGRLNKYEVCDCFGILEGRPMVRYKVDGDRGYKVGFATDTRCVTND